MARRPTGDERVFIIRVLKDATQHLILLSDFERSFVLEVATSYARFGDKFQTSNARMRVLCQIRYKLDIDMTGIDTTIYDIDNYEGDD